MSTGLICPYCGGEIDYEVGYGRSDGVNFTAVKTCFACAACGLQFFVELPMTDELRKCSECDMFKFIGKIAEEEFKKQYNQKDVQHVNNKYSVCETCTIECCHNCEICVECPFMEI